MKSFHEMSEEQLEELLQGCYRYQSSLMVNSKLPTRNRKEYLQYQNSVDAIERELDSRHRPTIAEQDTTRYVW